MTETRSLTRVVTPQLVRFSYVNVFKPKAAQDGGEEKYSVQLLIPKKNVELVAIFKKAIDAAIQEGVKSCKSWGGRIPPPNLFKAGLRDGDVEKPGEAAYAGMYFVNATSSNKPTVVDIDGNRILDPSDLYSGCWGRVDVNFYPFEKKSKGVACGLNNLQKVRDDDKFGGGPSAEDSFKDFFGKGDDDFINGGNSF